MLFWSSIYREVLLLSGRTCQNLNHNCAKVMTSHWSNFENMQDNIENEGWNKRQLFPHACSRLLCVLACMDLCIFLVIVWYLMSLSFKFHKSEFWLPRYLHNKTDIRLIPHFLCILHIFKIWSVRCFKFFTYMIWILTCSTI